MRKVSGIFAVILLALVLAACNAGQEEAGKSEPGGDDGPQNEQNELAIEKEEEAKDEATAPAVEEVATAAVSGTAPYEEGTPAASPVAGAEATPVTEASPVSEVAPATSASPMASPVASPMASPVPGASPAAVGAPNMNAQASAATPEVAASPVSATPAAVAEVVAPASDAEASPVATPGGTVALAGRVELAGTQNTAWTMSDEGCVGLGGNADLGAGRQVVIRDEAGVIVAVTTLEASDEQDACVWTFSANVAESDFYAISIPMKTELVFSHADIDENGGEITIILH